ncbi:unnamed protein product [Brassica napus]|uniref:S-acyltransferase n=2 Tax=Brassica napus TaxID=3708 RepID=A0A816XPV6_BRANA|nr:unnamed protein product [Brassica napus]
MIPYATIEEASLALGRNLTTLESLWFDYSATKSDYYLYCHNILFLFLIFSLVPLPLVFVELARSASGWFDRYKIQPKVKNSFSDMFRCYRDVMKMFILVVGPLQLVSYPSIQMIEIRSGLPLPSFGEIAAQLVVYFLVEDYTNYWVHRFFHSKWGYEKIHHIHHEYTAPIGYAAPYAHWAEVLLLGVPTFLGPAIAPGHMITFWLWIALRQIEAIETHSGYDFPWTLTKFIPFYGGAEYHDYHHYVGGQSQSNFASVFTYCDYIYGTDKGYRFQKKLLQQMAGIRSGLPLPSLMEIVAQLVVYFLIEDYTNYWIHRWLHCKWGYEKIHRVHHEYTSPIGYASPYAHWAEVLLLGIPTFLGPAIAPGHIMTFWLWISLRQMEAIETHSGYDLPWTLTKLVPFYGGAGYHDYHHYVGGKSQSNFASVFTYCDYIYGTDKGYRVHKKLLQQRAMAWNVFKYCTALRALGSIMILVVIGIIGFTYYALVVANYGPSLFLGGFDSLLALLVLALFHFLLIMLLWSYFSVVVTDPGGVPPGWRPELDIEKSDGNQEYSSLTVGDSSSHIVRYCRKCNQYKPPRSHHCSVCGRCILKMDHHCVWVVNCVGAKNYKSFLLFLFYTFLETTVVAISLFPVFLVFFTDGDSDVTVSPGSLAATFVAFVLNITFALSVLGFLIMHIMLVIRNTTTIEAYEKHTAPNSPYNLGRKQNFEQVFYLHLTCFYGRFFEVNGRSFPLLILDINTIKASFFKVSLFFLLDQVFGKDKLYWFVPLYT